MLKRIFFRGLVAVAPIAITIAIVVWLFDFVEGIFHSLIVELIGPRYYFTGLGVIIALALIFIVGILMSNWLTKMIYQGFEKLLNKMPFVKTLYQSISDLMSFFKKDSNASHGPVVIVTICGCKMLGLVSRDNFNDLPKGVGEEGEIAVFIPMSYQIGGMTVVVPKSMVTIIDMTIEQGLRFAATAGMPGQQTAGSNKA